MAPSHSKPDNGGSRTHTNNKVVLLPLVPLSEEKLTSDNSVQFQLLSTPTDPDSPKYKFSVRILNGSESVRTAIKWFRDTRKVITGLNITDYEPTVAMCKTMLTETALTSFNAAIEAGLNFRKTARIRAAANDAARRAIVDEPDLDIADNQDLQDITCACQEVLTQAMPRKVLAKVKRYLRRECRKPSDMKVRSYVQHIRRMNNEELPNMPPFGQNQNLGADELLDIVLFGTPKAWQREMDRQGFDPIASNLNAVLEFMENIEAAEAFDGDKKPAAKSNGKKSTTAPKNGGKTNGSTPKCLLHGYGHATEDCKVLQAEAKRLKGDHSSSSNQIVASKGNGNGKNKTWSRKAQEAKDKSKADMAAFIQAEVAKVFKKSAAAKKRKAEDGEISEDDNSLAAFDIKDFNYEDMDNLKIDDDDKSAHSC